MKTSKHPNVYSRWLCLGTLVLALANLSHAAQNYYVDAVAGNNSLDGKTIAKAWRTLDRVNKGPLATNDVYLPGDSILLKSGGVWSGSLCPLGSGLPASYIRIDKYGGAARPIINGGGAFPTRNNVARLESAAVWLYNQKYWEIRNLEITNYVSPSASNVLTSSVSSDGYRWGILIEAQYGIDGEIPTDKPNIKEYPGFRILDNVIHHVEGYDSDWDNGGNGTQKQKSTGGINFCVRRTMPYGAMADAYGQDGVSASVVHGAETYLDVMGGTWGNYNRKAVIKFKVADITNPITSAKLRFRARNLEDNTEIALKVYPASDTLLNLPDDWTDLNVSYNKLPTIGTQLNSVTILGNTDTDYEVDVTPYVQAQAGPAGDKIISFLVASTMLTAEARLVRIHSKEDGGDTAPQLIIVCGDTTPLRFRDVRIEGNNIYSVNACAISTRSGWASITTPYTRWDTQPDYTPWPGVVVSNNSIYDTARDGMIIRVTSNALIEHNVISHANHRSGSHGVGLFAFNAQHTTFQYNEVSDTYAHQKPGTLELVDGQGYDIDYLQYGTIFQYNYSHDNGGGFIVSTADGALGNTSVDSIIRYNISTFDRARIFRFSGGSANIQIYNNTVYVAPTFSGNIVDVSNWGGPWPTGARFTNNIIYNSSGSADYKFKDPTSGAGVSAFRFDNCLFYNTGTMPVNEPTGTTANYTVTNKQSANPMLDSVGSHANGWATVAGYKVRTGSPALGSGAVITATPP